MKRCYRCKTDKTTDDYHKNYSSRDGLQDICKSCTKDNNAKRYAANRESHLAYMREYRRQQRRSDFA